MQANVFGVPYHISFNEEVELDDSPCFGKLTFMSRAIEVTIVPDVECMQSALLHEILHAIDFEMPLGRGGMLREEEIRRIASSIFQFAHNNKEAWCYIFPPELFNWSNGVSDE